MKSNFNPQCITYSQMNMISSLRIAWRRLTTWARAYIISRYVGIGTAEELFGILYAEVLNFSDMLQLNFGREISRKNNQYLVQYIIMLRDLISADLEGNAAEVQLHVDHLFQNINDNAAFLESINPYWSAAEWKTMLETYLRYTIEEVNTFKSGEFKKDIETFDRLTALTDKMGDVFAQGLYEYIISSRIPEGGAAPSNSENCLTMEQMNNIYNIRMFWFELVTWVRSFMLSRYKGIGDENEVFNRLQQVPNDYTNNLEKFFGKNPAIDELRLELNAYIDLIDDFINAQKGGGPEEIGRITQLLYQNANERAASVSKLNPFWNETEWRSRLYNNLRSTLDESTTFLTGDYARNLDIYSTLLDMAESSSGYFAEGLIKYLKQKNLPA